MTWCRWKVSVSHQFIPCTWKLWELLLAMFVVLIYIGGLKSLWSESNKQNVLVWNYVYFHHNILPRLQIWIRDHWKILYLVTIDRSENCQALWNKLVLKISGMLCINCCVLINLQTILHFGRNVGLRSTF